MRYRSSERIRSKVKEIVPQYQWSPAEEIHRKPVQPPWSRRWCM